MKREVTRGINGRPVQILRGTPEELLAQVTSGKAAMPVPFEGREDDATAEKHLAGQHNQRKHGYRFGATPKLARARELRDAGLLQDYLGRARVRQGKPPTRRRVGAADGGVAPKPKPATPKPPPPAPKRKTPAQLADETIEEARDNYLAAERKLVDLDTEYKAASKRRTDIHTELRRAEKRRNKIIDDIDQQGRLIDEHIDDALRLPLGRERDAIETKIAKAKAKRDALKTKLDDEYTKRDALQAEDEDLLGRQNAIGNEVAWARTEQRETRQEYVVETAEARAVSMNHYRQEAAAFRASFDQRREEATRAVWKAESEVMRRQADYSVANSRIDWNKKLSDNPPDRVAQYDKAQEALLKATNAYGEAKAASDNFVSRALYRQKTSTLETDWQNGKHSVTDQERRDWEKGVSEFSKLVGEHPALQGAVEIGHMSRDHQFGQDGRARSYHYKGKVYLRDGARPDTVIHELGHVLEHRDPGIHAEVRAWYDRRTAGEQPSWLGGGFGKHEIARRDKFIDPYIGKEYGAEHDNSEVLSMGLEMFYENPTKMMTQDPDYFDLIYAVIRMGGTY